MTSFKQKYILTKNTGSTADNFNVVCNFLASVSLASEKEAGKGGGKGTLLLQRPQREEHLEHVTAAFKVWFGADDADMCQFFDKLKKSGVADTFSKDVIDLVMAAVNSHGTYTAGKLIKTETS